MDSPLSRQAIGMAVRGEDLVLVHASVRGAQIDWSLDRVPGLFREGDAPSVKIPERFRNPRATRVLVWPVDRMLRRDLDAAGQTEDDLRAAVGANLPSFFPTPADTALLWDLHVADTADQRRVAWLGGVFASGLEATLARLSEAGLAPSRVVPSGMGCAALRFAAGSNAEAPDRMLEVTPSGWATHTYHGLSWTGCRAGSGAPAESLVREARENGWLVCRWDDRAQPEEASRAMTIEHVAMGGALLAAPAHPRGATSFNLLGRTKGKDWLRSAPLRWTAAAAALTISLVIFADARAHRAGIDAQRLDAVAATLGRDAERVERLRNANDGMQGVHDRLARLESSYTPRWRMLAAITEATPDSAWVQRIEMTDHDFVLDVESASVSEVLGALEGSPDLGNAQQAAGQQTIEGGAARFRVMGVFDFSRTDDAQGGS
ncbi:MAG: hypothetical protein EA379_10445 [Phycisphaerales bacterium]|nr:MAG: hypothetical protein EA379_10445 [Phycisphaerales bacterium]